MRKGVAYLLRYQEVSRRASQRCLDLLAVVDDPKPAIQQLDHVTRHKNPHLALSVPTVEHE